jgi:hypothetical protein
MIARRPVAGSTWNATRSWPCWFIVSKSFMDFLVWGVGQAPGAGPGTSGKG